MDPSGDGSLIPVKIKDGEINDKRPTLCYDEFIKLLENASATAQSLAKQMCTGKKNAEPYYKNNVNACRFCSMRDVCEKAI
jgi:ATP-dependent helicase/DNAse subunit B